MKTWYLTLATVFGLALNGSIAAEPWTFESAIAEALRNNPDMRLAQQRIAAAQAGLQQANAAFMPQVQVQSSNLRTDNPVTVFGKIIAQATESVELTRARFAQGLAISTQLIDADTTLIAARVRRAEAEAEQRIAVAALRKALGLTQLDSFSGQK